MGLKHKSINEKSYVDSTRKGKKLPFVGRKFHPHERKIKVLGGGEEGKKAPVSLISAIIAEKF